MKQVTGGYGQARKMNLLVWEKGVAALNIRIRISLPLFFLLSTPASPQWVQTGGLYGIDIHCLYVSSGDLFAGTSWRGVFLSTDNGTTWMQTGQTYANVLALSGEGSNLFAGTWNGVLLSTDNGTTWKQTALTNIVVDALTMSGGTLFAGAVVGGVCLTTDSGTTWIISAPTNSSVLALMTIGENLFAGTAYDGILRSTNKGATWMQTGLTSTNVWAIVVIDANLFAGTWDGVFSSIDSGITWERTGFRLIEVRALAAIGENIFAGTDYGVFSSTDNGTSWKQVNTGLTYTIVRSLVAKDGFLFAGTYGGGVWRRPLSEMIVSVESEPQTLPREFALEQNYPNPFNPATTIRYALPQSAKVRIAIYDLLGREVEILVDEVQTAGWQEVRWETSRMPSGIYLYTITAGAFRETRKMILIK